MITKIVYCLVSDNKDYYYEHLLISLYSLRKHNNNANVIVVCDKDTHDTFKGNRTEIFNYSNSVKVVDVPLEWTKWRRSRYIKTNLRFFIEGDFLYIDTDTIICASLDFVDSYQFDIGAVYDCHVERRIPGHNKCSTEKWVNKFALELGKDITGFLHFNSGVLYVKDVDIAHELYKKWFDIYYEYQEKGYIIDQLPLMIANKELGEVISIMDSRLNCQTVMKESKEILSEAKIIHYFPQQGYYSICSSWILDPLKETGKIPCTIMKIIEDPYAYFKEYSAIISGPSVNLVKSPLLETYIRSPRLFRFFVYMSQKYHLLKNLVWKIVNR